MRTASLLLLVAAALALTPLARADGDPASDVLITQDVFLPYGEGVPDRAGKDLFAVVAKANKAGYRIKVALIASRSDLGLVQSLWVKPKTYAPFLGRELLFVYKQTLVIVMPNGFGVFHDNKDVSREYQLLSGIRIPPGPAGLAEAMRTAVLKLSAAAGHPIATGGGSGGFGSLDRILIAVGALILLGVLIVLSRAVRGRRSAELRSEE